MTLIDKMLEHIDSSYTHIMQRPQMYAADAQCLQLLFTTLESFREFILRDGEESSELSGFAEFGISQGWGSADFITRRTGVDNVLTPETQELMEDVCAMWREFLASQQRIQQSGDSKS